jgi:hypothetical protein
MEEHMRGIALGSRMVVALFASLMLGSVQAAFAAASNPRDAPFFAVGDATTTCGEFTAQPEATEKRLDWVLGYISGRNREALGSERETGDPSLKMPATVLGWLESYCGSHALDTLIFAADRLRSETIKREGRGR